MVLDRAGKGKNKNSSFLYDFQISFPDLLLGKRRDFPMKNRNIKSFTGISKKWNATWKSGGII